MYKLAHYENLHWKFFFALCFGCHQNWMPFATVSRSVAYAPSFCFAKNVRCQIHSSFVDELCATSTIYMCLSINGIRNDIMSEKLFSIKVSTAIVACTKSVERYSFFRLENFISIIWKIHLNILLAFNTIRQTIQLSPLHTIKRKIMQTFHLHTKRTNWFEPIAINTMIRFVVCVTLRN